MGAGLCLLLAVLFKTPWPVSDKGLPEYTSSSLGRLIMSEYLLPFEVAAMLLLAALVGASLLASREPGEEGES